MKKLVLLTSLVFFVLACSLIKPPFEPFEPTVQPPPTVPPQVTIIVEFPDRLPTATVEPRVKPILGDDKSDAASFFLITKTRFMAGDDQGIAESVKYPIKVSLNGRETTINTVADFVKSYKDIFNDKVTKALTETDEDSLLITANGVRIGTGEIWFNQFCSDAICAKGEFLITQVNN